VEHCMKENAGGTDWPEPDPKGMAALIAAGLAQLACGGYAIKRNRPGWFPIWLFALLV